MKSSPAPLMAPHGRGGKVLARACRLVYSSSVEQALETRAISSLQACTVTGRAGCSRCGDSRAVANGASWRPACLTVERMLIRAGADGPNVRGHRCAIEDDAMVTLRLRILTTATPKTIADIEALMRM